MPGMMGLGLTPTQMPAELGGWGKVKGKESAEEAEKGVHYRTEGSGVSCWLV
jgi:hypothetical protein